MKLYCNWCWSEEKIQSVHPQQWICCRSSTSSSFSFHDKVIVNESMWLKRVTSLPFRQPSYDTSLGQIPQRPPPQLSSPKIVARTSEDGWEIISFSGLMHVEHFLVVIIISCCLWTTTLAAASNHEWVQQQKVKTWTLFCSGNREDDDYSIRECLGALEGQ